MAISEIVAQGMGVARTEQYIASLLADKPRQKRGANVGTFLSSLDQSLAKIQQSGVAAISERRETESQIVLTITIPKL